MAQLAEIPLDRGLTVRRNGVELALFHLGGEVFAFEARCPHRGGPLGESLREGDKFYCPMHGWEFELRTGNCRENPEKRVKSYPSRIVGSEVQVKLD